MRMPTVRTPCTPYALSTTATLLGNIALRVGRTIEWDAKAERITNCPEANAHLAREYRSPWKLEA